MNGDSMKSYRLMILIPLFAACTSHNASLENLEANAKEFNDFSNSAYLINDKEILFFTLSGNQIEIQLINKDRLSENKIVECSVNKKTVAVTEDSSKDWDNNYIITLDQAVKKAKIECKLSDGSTIKKTLEVY